MGCGWIIGRGASIAHGLTWTVPSAWYEEYAAGRESREQLVGRIVSEMRLTTEATDPVHYAKMIEILVNETRDGWVHYLTTTNWDYLAQGALDQRRKALGSDAVPYNKIQGVHHFNGSAEPGQWENRSQFVLEVDSQVERRRIWSLEAQSAFDALLVAPTLVVVGMSFECSDDVAFVRELARHRHAGTWDGAHLILVDPSEAILRKNHDFLLHAFGKVTVEEIPIGFEKWVASGLRTSKIPLFHG